MNHHTQYVANLGWDCFHFFLWENTYNPLILRCNNNWSGNIFSTSDQRSWKPAARRFSKGCVFACCMHVHICFRGHACVYDIGVITHTQSHTHTHICIYIYILKYFYREYIISIKLTCFTVRIHIWHTDISTIRISITYDFNCVYGTYH